MHKTMTLKTTVAVLLMMISSLSYSLGPVIAHRGVHHLYDCTELTNATCTADRIYPPVHELFENTLASMEAAFSAGADWVELDIHPTVDGHFAVFHDWALECRTDGQGVTREQTMTCLKTLDIGYGYTADSGESTPLRGKGVGLMPSLTEVFQYFPDGKFLIDIKSKDMEEARILGEFLGQFPPRQRQHLMVYGGTDDMLEYVAGVSGIKAWPSKPRIAQCYRTLLSSEGQDLGECAGQIFGGPLSLAEKVPGWPDDFISMVHETGGEFYVMEIDAPEDIDRLGPDYKGGIWTDRIEVLSPMLKEQPPLAHRE
ncbi:glycerophosphodiester phosphodiesterase family protein [Hahella ganghwensis]|uniref:glycerophosphodiester phosphodiesterase family protein n=1 Tax=Hahella ganghwensis TaxID=286420 RepID=UPI000381CBDA|nr:glycerophosphodiester phosphodiesterase family protein [Hahella ganghwensis]